ncbi:MULTISPECIES: c-type cytochrome [unclassified Lysobacter]|uniref:c-type cytochrome n=1 Tax=unclassified Lysobacter TaxID=2635362 RepID=UPI001BEAE4F9|nr:MULTISPECIES: c-type cytochrome [unclassified Lysobacter]MBT2748790.1 c-type cytochrome [Lysobacter sp. ISL-42]MBT2754328.1 c-type cytochrome [Lysobacter sp. ISL-50]MBT2779890.1 c-type cytochrome [Lysobacter sp. ISL-54]MBT2783046.1 c-type cytochrome [Lysobacter sp. ISL-52]
MKKWAARVLKIVLGVAALLALALGGALWRGAQLRERQVDVAVAPLAYAEPTHGALQHGGYLYRSRGCQECHGGDGAGRVFIDDPNGLRVRAPNITGGAGSAIEGYRERDWVRAIRHGLDRDSHPLMIMPSEDYNRFTDADLAALVAYVRQLPPIAGGAAELRFPLPVRVVYGLGLMQDAAAKIDHALPPPAPVAVAASVEHGAYVAAMCQGCHGPGFGGGTIPGAPPQWPAAANLTPGAGSAMPRYAGFDAFKAMMRSGRRPDGGAIDPAMPFATMAALDDTDLRALHLYLRQLPAKAQGSR